MATERSPVSWGDFEARAPRLAALGSERFERTRVAILGTVRADGSPRISPIEPVLANGRLLLGAMPSLKRGDLERDPRCALHSSISDVNGSEGEFKIHGRAILAGDEIRDAEYEAWWIELSARVGGRLRRRHSERGLCRVGHQQQRAPYQPPW